jgi:ABC-2 type transport system ATP-binding protein
MIHLAGVSKEYGFGPRRVRALDEFTLDVPPGTALGLVGPNGAGKSTLIRLLLGYLRPTTGEASIAGLPPRTYAEKHGVGYVSESLAIPLGWTVRGALRAFAALGSLEGDVAERIDAALRQMGIEGVADRRISALSKGNLQRVGIAQALLGERMLLILDEPLDGLDPEWIVRLRGILANWRAADPRRVLLVASHNLDEVERIADQVAVLDGGKLREVVELRPEPGLPAYHLEVHDAGSAALVRELFPGAQGTNGTAFHVTATDLAELNRRVAVLLERGGQIRALTPERASLEHAVRRTFGGGE